MQFFFIIGSVCLFLFSISLEKKKNNQSLINNIIYSFKLNVYDFSFLSSFAFLLSIFVWRFFIVNLFGKDEAIVYFICFAIASLPATILNNYLGITLIKKNKNSFLNYIIFIILYFFISYLFFYLQKNYLIYVENSPYFNLSIEILTISLIGTILMLLGINARIEILNSNLKNRYELFKSDFIYGIIIALIVPLLGFLNYLELIKYSYFISSLLTLIFYFVLKKKLIISK